MTPYDLSKSDPTSVLWGGEIRTDEQQETTEPLKDTKGRPISKNEEYFIVLVKKGYSIVILRTDEVEESTNRYIVHAEDIAEFCFDEKDHELIWACVPISGEALLKQEGY